MERVAQKEGARRVRWAGRGTALTGCRLLVRLGTLYSPNTQFDGS